VARSERPSRGTGRFRKADAVADGKLCVFSEMGKKSDLLRPRRLTEARVNGMARHVATADDSPSRIKVLVICADRFEKLREFGQAVEVRE